MIYIRCIYAVVRRSEGFYFNITSLFWEDAAGYVAIVRCGITLHLGNTAVTINEPILLLISDSKQWNFSRRLSLKNNKTSNLLPLYPSPSSIRVAGDRLERPFAHFVLTSLISWSN